MSAIRDESGPAFPSANDVIAGQYQTSGHAGMTLRDFFAAKAMTGLAYDGLLIDAMDEESCALVIQNAAALSYRLADAMLKARQS